MDEDKKPICYEYCKFCKGSAICEAHKKDCPKYEDTMDKVIEINGGNGWRDEK